MRYCTTPYPGMMQVMLRRATKLFILIFVFHYFVKVSVVCMRTNGNGISFLSYLFTQYKPPPDICILSGKWKRNMSGGTDWLYVVSTSGCTSRYVIWLVLAP